MKFLNISLFISLISFNLYSIEFQGMPFERPVSDREQKSIFMIELSLSRFHKAFKIDGLNRYALHEMDSKHFFYVQKDNKAASDFMTNNCKLYNSWHGVMTFNFDEIIMPKNDLVKAFIHELSPGVELFHAYQFQTPFTQDIYSGANKEYRSLDENTCGPPWIIEGTADALAIASLQDTKHISQTRLTQISQEVPRLFGSRRYDLSLDFNQLKNQGYKSEQFVQGSHATSSFWLWLMREYSREADKFSELYNPRVIKNLFQHKRSSLTGQYEDPTGIKWLRLSLSKAMKASLTTLLPDFYSYIGSVASDSLSYRDEYERKIKRYKQYDFYDFSKKKKTNFFKAVFHNDKSDMDSNNPCTEVQLKDASVSSFSIKAKPYTAGCIRLIMNDLSSDQVAISASLPMMRSLENMKKLNWLNLGWGGFTRSQYIEESKEFSKDSQSKSRWLLYRSAPYFRNTPTQEAYLTYSIVPADRTAHSSQEVITYNFEISHSFNNITYKGAQKPKPPKSPITSKEAYEEKTPGVYKPIKEHHGFGEAANILSLDLDVMVDNNCVPSTYNICQKNQMTLTLSEGSSGFDARFVDYHLYKRQMIKAPNPEQIFAGKSVRIQLPFLPFGFVGTIQNAGLVFSESSYSLEAISPEVINDQNFQSTAQVTIEEFSEKVIRGSYGATLRDPQDKTPLKVMGEVSGTFYIYNPLKYNDEVVSMSPSNYTTRRQFEAITKRFDLDDALFETVNNMVVEVGQEREKSFQELRQPTRYSEIPLPSTPRPDPKNCPCSCDLYRSSSSSMCAPFCPLTFDVCKKRNADSISKSLLLQTLEESLAAQMMQGLPPDQARRNARAQVQRMTNLPMPSLRMSLKQVILYDSK